MAAPSSVTKTGKNEPWGLQVSRGQISWHRSITVFGFNPDVDTAEESVWPDGGVVPHGQAPSVLSVSSSSGSDAEDGVGARTVYIEGLDVSYNEISETVTLNGQTSVSTTYTYSAVNNLSVISAGSSAHNVGTINVGTGVVTAGVPAVLWDLIAETFNQRTTGHYTVPAGHTAYMPVGIFTAGQPSGSTEVVGKLRITDNISGLQRVGAILTLNNGSVQFDFSYPLAIPEKSSIGATAKGSAANNSASTMFNMVLIKNDAGVS